MYNFSFYVSVKILSKLHWIGTFKSLHMSKAKSLKFSKYSVLCTLPETKPEGWNCKGSKDTAGSAAGSSVQGPGVGRWLRKPVTRSGTPEARTRAAALWRSLEFDRAGAPEASLCPFPCALCLGTSRLRHLAGNLADSWVSPTLLGCNTSWVSVQIFQKIAPKQGVLHTP